MKNKVIVCLLIASMCSGAISGSVFAAEGETEKTGTMDTGVRILAGLSAALGVELTFDPGGTGFNDMRKYYQREIDELKKSAKVNVEELKSLEKQKAKSKNLAVLALTYAATSGTYAALGTDRIVKGAEKVSDMVEKPTVGLSTEKSPRASQDAAGLN